MLVEVVFGDVIELLRLLAFTCLAAFRFVSDWAQSARLQLLREVLRGMGQELGSWSDYIVVVHVKTSRF